MTMGAGDRFGGGRAGARISARDAEAQRALNALAPKIPDLLPRIARLFAPHNGALATGLLVLVGAGLSVSRRCSPSRPSTAGSSRRGALAPTCRCCSSWSRIMVVLWSRRRPSACWQTYLTAKVGNKVMGALRVRLFAHLQAMELGFFTRTKTGVIQSRLQNDVGGVAGVLTNTVTSVLGNIVTVIAALVAMLLLDWQLTIVAVVLLPVLVIAQRRVGQVRARIAARRRSRCRSMTAITQETLSVSGILLAKSFNRQQAESARYARRERATRSRCRCGRR